MNSWIDLLQLLRCMHRGRDCRVLRRNGVVLLLVHGKDMAMLDLVWETCEWLRCPGLHVIQRARGRRDVRLHVVLVDPEMVETGIDL